VLPGMVHPGKKTGKERERPKKGKGGRRNSRHCGKRAGGLTRKKKGECSPQESKELGQTVGCSGGAIYLLFKERLYALTFVGKRKGFRKSSGQTGGEGL